MAEIKNRELSQFSSFLHIDDVAQEIGITTEATPHVGIGTTNPTEKLHVVGNILCDNDITADFFYGSGAYLTGVSTFAASNFDNFSVTGVATISTGVLGSLSGQSGLITNFTSGISSITQLRVLSGIVTNISGTAATYTDGNFVNLYATNSYLVSGIATNLSGSTINYSGISTFSGVKILSGIVTSSSAGIVSYFGDGSGLTGITVDLTLQSDSSLVGSALTTLNFTNTNGGVSLASNIATINVGKAAAGSSGHIQYKNATGIFSGSSNFTFDDATNSVSIAGTCSAANFNSTSDINLKENIETVSDALKIVLDLRGVKFDWKKNQAPSIGVIAQEIEQVLPELVTQSNPKTVNYDGIIGVLIEAIKELKSEVDSLKNSINNQ